MKRAPDSSDDDSDDDNDGDQGARTAATTVSVGGGAAAYAELPRAERLYAEHVFWPKTQFFTNWAAGFDIHGRMNAEYVQHGRGGQFTYVGEEVSGAVLADPEWLYIGVHVYDFLSFVANAFQFSPRFAHPFYLRRMLWAFADFSTFADGAVHERAFAQQRRLQQERKCLYGCVVVRVRFTDLCDAILGAYGGGSSTIVQHIVDTRRFKKRESCHTVALLPRAPQHYARFDGWKQYADVASGAYNIAAYCTVLPDGSAIDLGECKSMQAWRWQHEFCVASCKVSKRKAECVDMHLNAKAEKRVDDAIRTFNARFTDGGTD